MAILLNALNFMCKIVFFMVFTWHSCICALNILIMSWNKKNAGMLKIQLVNMHELT